MKKYLVYFLGLALVASTIIAFRVNAQNIDTLSVKENYINKAKSLSSTTNISDKDTSASSSKNINSTSSNTNIVNSTSSTNNINSTSNSPTPIIAIDAGHGGYDSGAVGPSGIKEKDIALQIALKLGQLLQNQGYKVIYTRTSDNVPWPSNVHSDLKTRTQIANDINADYFISIHNNDSKFPSSNGTQTFFSYNSTRGRYLANSVQNELIKSVHLQNRGIKTANYYVLRHTTAPAILTELAFISNPKEEALLTSDDFQNKCAQAIATGILASINQ
jgi:N-acetylmuramoyl-L-alanine amidase